LAAESAFSWPSEGGSTLAEFIPAPLGTV